MIGPRPPETATTPAPLSPLSQSVPPAPRRAHWEQRAWWAVRDWVGRRRAGIGAAWADLTVDVGNVSAGIVGLSCVWFWAAIWLWDMPASGKLAWTGGSFVAAGGLLWLYGLWMASREPREGRNGE